MSIPRRIGLAATLLCLFGCGSGDGPTLSISPRSATVTAGGPAVLFKASQSGSSNAISWALTGPGSIAASSGAATSYLPPGSISAATTATLTASAGSSLNSSATITINPGGAITVVGKVLDNSFIPFAGAKVTIGTKSTLSDVNGHFSLSGVDFPYDLTVTLTSPEKLGVLYKGLTRTDPTILVPESVAMAPNSGDVTGNLTGGDPLGMATETTMVAWGSPEIPFGKPSNPVFGNPYSLNLFWPGPSSTTGTVHALQWEVDANALPTTYKGYGTRTGVTIINSGNANADIVMSPPATSTVAGTITIPASFNLDSTELALNFGDNSGISLGVDNSSSTSFSYPFPSGIGGTAMVTANASLSGTQVALSLSGIAPGTTNAVLDIPSPSTAVLPPDVGMNVGTTTDFTWTSMTGAVYILSVFGPTGAPSYHVFTTATTARIPDLGSEGLGLPPATQYAWTVVGLGPASSVDALAGPTSILPPGNTLFLSQAASRTFTTP
jgi:hypothetical protein